MIGIYKITNIINNKVYIGQSKNILFRWQKHRTIPFNPNHIDYDKLLYRAIRKYGLNNFEFEVIEECSIGELDQKEIYWIKYYDSCNRNKGYNNTLKCIKISHCKLNEEYVNQIIDLLHDSCMSLKEIAQLYNISENTVRSINKGKSWIDENRVYPIRNKQTIDNQNCNIINRMPKKRYNIPEIKELISVFNNYNYNKEKVAEKYKVSGALIRKWCLNYGFNCQNKKELKCLYDKLILNKQPKENIKYKILQLDNNKNIIAQFNTKIEAVKSLGKKGDNISTLNKAIKFNTLYRGYYWVLLPDRDER